jgi:hypothetical protein
MAAVAADHPVHHGMPLRHGGGGVRRSIVSSHRAPNFSKTRLAQESDIYHRLQSLLLGKAEVFRLLFLALFNDVLPTTNFALSWLGDHVLKFKIIREYWRYRSRISVYVSMRNCLSHYRQITMKYMLPCTKIEI